MQSSKPLPSLYYNRAIYIENISVCGIEQIIVVSFKFLQFLEEFSVCRTLI